MQTCKTKLLILLITVFYCCVAISAVPKNNQVISLDFDNVKVRNLLLILARYAHKNILVSDKIVAAMSIHLHDVTSETALDYILQGQGLQQRGTKDAILVLPASDATIFDTAAQSQNPAVGLLDVNYAPADTLVTLLSKQNGFLAANENMVADKRINKLLIQAPAPKVAAIKKIIGLIDVPVKQLLIKAKIVSVDTSVSRELGLKFGTMDKADMVHNVQMDLPLETFDTGHFNLALAKLADNKLLDLELAALENEGRGKIISSPKLLTLDRKVAYIESGAEIPYQEKASRGATSIAFKKAALSLKVTPEITAHDFINLDIQLSQDKISNITINGVPAIDTRRIQTQVLVRSGETIVLGGIYEWTNESKASSTPLLNKIPLLSILFSKHESKSERKELLIFVTPKILENTTEAN
jgi:type IV pilus assembly protein PilQ